MVSTVLEYFVNGGVTIFHRQFIMPSVTEKMYIWRNKKMEDFRESEIPQVEIPEIEERELPEFERSTPHPDDGNTQA